MSSSFTYTFTNLCRLPSSVTICPARAGKRATRLSKTCPTVSPSASTDALPPAWALIMVGKRTSTDTGASRLGGMSTDLVRILPALQNHRLLGDVPVDDAVAPDHRCLL